MLEERVKYLQALPEHVYKMASITFFTKEESPTRYDEAVGERRVKEWSDIPNHEMYDFFLHNTALVQLVPSLAVHKNTPGSENYLTVKKQINDQHLTYLQGVLSRTE